MTREQVKDSINNRFPELQRENVVRWSVIMNLIDQIETPQIKLVVSNFVVAESKINQTPCLRSDKK